MKSMCKKLLAVLLAVMTAASFTAAAAAEEKDGGTATLTGYTDVPESKDIYNADDGLLTIADSEVKDGAVISYDTVGERAFCYDEDDPDTQYLAEVVSVVVAAGIGKIEKYAFAHMPALREVTFKGDVDIGEAAFSGCHALEKVVFEKSAVIGDRVFKNCTALESFVVPENADFDTVRGAFTDTAFYRDYDVDFVTIGSTLVAYKGFDKSVMIPDNITRIGRAAFKDNTALEEIVITKFVDTLSDEAFMNCINLKSVKFNAYGEITRVGRDVFTNTCYFNTFPGEFFAVGNYLIKYLGHDAYVSIPNTITAIAPYCFDGCYTTSENGGRTYVVSAIFVSASVKSFGENCFGLAELEDGTFYVPRIYAYSRTKIGSVELLKKAGYNPTIMPAPGDVDGDGTVSASDAREALRIAVSLDKVDRPIYIAADIDGGGQVGADDARRILRLTVGLENYTAEDLLYIPRTTFEILQAYSNALRSVAKYNAGYKKEIINTPGECSMSFTAAKTYGIEKVLSKQGYENSANTYEPHSKHEQDPAFGIDYAAVVSPKAVKYARCMMEKDNKYSILIMFNDTLDNDGTSDIAKVFPAQTRDYYKNILSGEKWWGNKKTSVSKFDLTYNDAVITMIVDADTFRPESCQLSLGYHFDLAGKIIGVTDIGKKGSDATFERHDVVKYSEFAY